MDLSNLEECFALKLKGIPGPTIEKVKIEAINRKTGEVLLSFRVLHS